MHEDLLRELRDLAREAESFLEIMAGENMLPKEFPKEQLQDYMQALIGLQSGSQEGCKVPLEQMRNELPRIRRENIVDQETLEDKFAELDDDDLPPLERGGMFDNGLKSIISAVTVAYDEYRESASLPITEDIITEKDATVPQVLDESRSLIQTSTIVEDRLKKDVKEATENLPDDQEEVAEFKKSLKDANNANYLVRGFLKGSGIIRHWYNAASLNLVSSGKRIERAGNTLKRSSIPLAGITLLSGASIPATALSILLIQNFGERLEEFGHTLDEIHKNSNGSIPDVDTKRQIEAEKMALDLLSAGKQVPNDVAADVRVLRFEGRFEPDSIFDFSTISSFPYLTGIELFSPYWDTLKIRNFEEIGHHKELQTLEITNSDLQNINPIASLKKLRRLNLSNSMVNELPNMEGFSHLTWLSLNYSPIKDMDPVSKCLNLKRLYLNETKVDNIFPVGNLVNLEELFLNGTTIENLAPLGYLKNLRHLQLGRQADPLGYITHLIPYVTTLYVNNKRIYEGILE